MKSRAAAWMILALLPAGTRAEGRPDSHLETRFFHLRSNVEGVGTADLSGMELQWALSDPRGSFRMVLPALSMSGPASVVSLGPTFGSYPRGPGSAGGNGPGPGGGGGAGNGTLAAAAPTAGGEMDLREYGLGDARLLLRRQVGEDGPWGRIFLDGGAKLPTAEKEKGLGTGEPDLWTGVGWRYEGWVANLEAWLEWIHLGDPPGVTLEDGPGGGLFVEFPGGRGGLGVGLQASRAVLEGEPALVQVVVDGYRRWRSLEWGVAASGGLSDSAPDLGVSFSLRF